MTESIRIALIDDDAAILDSLRLYFERRKVKVSCFGTTNEFLGEIDSFTQFDCVVSDVRMPGMCGIELVGHLKARNLNWPIVLITGHGDVDMAVSAIKTGAFDFIEKPCDETRLLTSIRNAVQQYRQRMSSAVELQQLRSRFSSLSPRQHQVMELVVAGLSSKEIGMRLHLSAKTVDNHRAWVMERIGARNLAELVRMATTIQARP